MVYLYSDSFIVVNVHQCHETDLNDILVPANFNNNKKHYDMANKQMQFNFQGLFQNYDVSILPLKLVFIAL
ncbi:hypothetical protein TY91_05340 [Secundilactobacillus collinoides]|uniref:Uncharacterized protein n=2 Tax=Secundilactobacillus collinoides TaxID=33960 RepID=A0A0R2B2X9_SECCO|nr:hypothetical protein FC82_GL001377 [Secundilactobacillus collinoides DSM 20515 = JCM 1123]KZL41814.1 hypothetical protein TY91_05340 [Secundilactobacillus collinoides]